MAFLADCLNSLLSQDYPNFEVIVVDNASDDGTPDWVAAHYPQVRLIRNERNLGFAAGVNVGLRAAAGEALLLLNQDTVVRPGWLRALVETAQAAPDVGIVGSKALYPDGTIQHAGGYVDERGESGHYGHGEAAADEFDHRRDVDFVTGAALAITRQAFEAIDGLDEGFSPAYYEDVDWCYRARAAGFRVVYAPEAALVHKESSGFAGLSHEQMYLFHRNRLRFVLKHWPLRRLVDEFAEAERNWLAGLDQGGERLVAALHHAYLYHLLHLAEVVAWRQKLLAASANEADVLAGLLLALRTVVPLGPVHAGGQKKEMEDRAQLLEELRQRWMVHGGPSRTSLPLLGPLLAAFRYVWDRIFVWPMIKRQMEFNLRVVSMLERIEHRQERLGEVLAEYIAENGREAVELAQEIRQLRHVDRTQNRE